MFKARAYRKNTYLHKVLNSEQPVETNAYLAAALADMHPPAATMPCLDLDDETQYDIHSAPLGYGRWGMPLLCAQLASPKPYVRLCAIHTLCEELVNPKKAYLAVQKYAVLKRLTTMLRLDLNGEHGFQHLPVVRALQALQTMAGHLIAAEAIAGNAALMAVLADVVMWSNVYVRTEAAVVLALIAGFYPAADTMVQNGYLTQTMLMLQRWPDLCALYELLAALTERAPQAALDAGSFEFLLPRLQCAQPCQPFVLRSFAIAIQCADGQRRCDNTPTLLPILVRILDVYTPDADLVVALPAALPPPPPLFPPEPAVDWRPNTAHLEWAAAALHGCLCSGRLRWQCQTFGAHVAELLVLHAHCKHNWRLQVHSMQALRHATEMPAVKQFVRTVCLRRLAQVNCASGEPEVGRVKRALLRWLRHRNYRLEPEELLL